MRFPDARTTSSAPFVEYACGNRVMTGGEGPEECPNCGAKPIGGFNR